MTKFGVKLSTAAIICLLVIFSCAKDTDNFGDRQKDTVIVNEALAEKGHIRIKITPELEDKMITASRSGGDIVSTGNVDIDKLAKAIGASRVERTFPYGGKFEERMRREGLHLWYEVYFDEYIPVTRAIEGFIDLTGVQVVEPSYIPVQIGDSRIIETVTGAAMVPANNFSYGVANSFSDPMLSQQWHYYNDGSLTTSVAGADINLFPGWEIETGNPAVIVCVQDGGVEHGHEDLAANMWINEAEANGVPGVDDDGNGYIDDIHGWNFYDNVAEIKPNNHGTHVAGTVAAVNNNGTGVAGVAGGNGSANSGVRIMTCQLASTLGEYTSSENIKRSFIYAAHNGAVIAQNSWGYPPGTELPQSDKEAIDYFIRYAGLDENDNQTGPLRGGLAIFAAGNHASKNTVYPAALPEVLAISAMGPNFIIPFYSNYGPHIDLVAPGGNTTNYGTSHGVLSTGTKNKYVFMEGTSMACPHVSGIAALVVSKYGVANRGLTAEKVKEILLAAGNEDIYTYNPTFIFLGEKRLGKGYIDTYKAIMTDVEFDDFPPDHVADLAAVWNFNSVMLQWSVTRDMEDVVAAYYDIVLSTESLSYVDFDNPPANAIVRSVTVEGKNAGDGVSETIGGLSDNTSYNIVIAARDSNGNRSSVAVLPGRTLNLSPGDQTVYTELNVSTTIDASDILGKDNKLSYAIENPAPGAIEVSVSDNGEISVKPLRYGVAEFTVTATDPDNISAAFKITSICRDSSREADLYPNPVTDLLNIRMGQDVSGTIQIDITNSRGIRVFAGQENISPYSPATVDMSRMTAGGYTVVITYNGQKITRSISKI